MSLGKYRHLDIDLKLDNIKKFVVTLLCMTQHYGYTNSFLRSTFKYLTVKNSISDICNKIFQKDLKNYIKLENISIAGCVIRELVYWSGLFGIQLVISIMTHTK